MTEFNFSLSQEIWQEQAAYDAELSKWVNIYNSFVHIICSSLERRRKDSFFSGLFEFNYHSKVHKN